MIIEQKHWSNSEWKETLSSSKDVEANLVLVFGGRHQLSDGRRFEEIKEQYPNANILVGSTSGEILDTEVHDDTLVLTAIQFEKTTIEVAKLTQSEIDDSFSGGEVLAKRLLKEGLRHIFVLSDGLKVNGSELVKGFESALPSTVSVTGGLAGDAARFEQTLVGLNGVPEEGSIAAIGFYGNDLKIGHGSQGGWDPFGPERKVTKSKNNVLYEIDGQSALELYKMYLGDKADGLPGTGLLFPLSIREEEGGASVVRTLLAIDEEAQSMTFAGDIAEGATAQLMKANFDKLIDASVDAAESSSELLDGSNAELAILVSCVGRKLVLGQRIEEEVEEVREVLGNGPAITGFYSYGEVSPIVKSMNCELHNQTMTITTFSEN
ncbi:MAG: hypothetical protein CL833_11495 [Crocinitomicaceae bacterium]|nr:hypothetical protein [Crocinitomicaceae bacterium]